MSSEALHFRVDTRQKPCTGLYDVNLKRANIPEIKRIGLIWRFLAQKPMLEMAFHVFFLGFGLAASCALKAEQDVKQCQSNKAVRQILLLVSFRSVAVVLG